MRCGNESRTVIRVISSLGVLTVSVTNIGRERYTGVRKLKRRRAAITTFRTSRTWRFRNDDVRGPTDTVFGIRARRAAGYNRPMSALVRSLHCQLPAACMIVHRSG